MTLPSLAPLVCLLGLSACSPKFDGPEKVEGLRLLAVLAEPPELGAAADGSGAGWPKGTASIRSLVGHPGFVVDGAPRAVVLHLTCTPTPGDPKGTACTTISELSQPSDLLLKLSFAQACNSPGQGAAGTITFSGLEACSRDGCGPLFVPLDPADPSSQVALPSPSYVLPTSYSLAALPAGNTQRVLGVDAVDLALVVEASPGDLAPASAVPDACTALTRVLTQLSALWPSRSHLAGLKWIHVRGPDMPAASLPNHNPSVSGITLSGAPLPAPGEIPLAAKAGKAQDLLPVLPGPFDTLRELYERFDTSGQYHDTREEEWAYSWFATSGDLDHAHTSTNDTPDAFTPAHGRALVWLVVRDLRGGTAFTAGEVLSP